MIIKTRQTQPVFKTKMHGGHLLLFHLGLRWGCNKKFGISKIADHHQVA
jgi:hypothetical protein